MIESSGRCSQPAGGASSTATCPADRALARVWALGGSQKKPKILIWALFFFCFFGLVRCKSSRLEWVRTTPTGPRHLLLETSGHTCRRRETEWIGLASIRKRFFLFYDAISECTDCFAPPNLPPTRLNNSLMPRSRPLSSYASSPHVPHPHTHGHAHFPHRMPNLISDRNPIPSESLFVLTTHPPLSGSGRC